MTEWAEAITTEWHIRGKYYITIFFPHFTKGYSSWGWGCSVSLVQNEYAGLDNVQSYVFNSQNSIILFHIFKYSELRKNNRLRQVYSILPL